MNGLLQKQWFVALLVIAALVEVYVNVIDPMLGNRHQAVKAKPLAVVQQSYPAIIALDNHIIEGGTEEGTDWELLGRTKIARSPFSERASSSVDIYAASDDADAAKEVVWPRLSAIAITSTGKLAVIGGRVMHAGERVSGFELREIRQNYVLLGYADQRRKIKIQPMGR